MSDDDSDWDINEEDEANGSPPSDCSAKRWKAVRYIREEYEALGNTREEALDYLSTHGDPHTVTVTKETIAPATD